MPKRQKMLAEINEENGLGILLMAQMDGVPDTVQLMVVSARYDPEVDGLREIGHYVIRALWVREHRISVGMFSDLSFKKEEEHPLLYGYNTRPVGVFFRGEPDNPNELVLDIIQSYASTFGPWRHIPEFINAAQPLNDLVSSGGGLLGEMPGPLAQRMDKTLQHHQLETRLIEAQRAEGQEEPDLLQVLLLDDSYVVALDFSVEELGKV